ncbi:MAG: AMP-binding protein, partial [Ruminiclostridium sp.]|nr:AMP-binding protein [Ruminiclostridium sp.]
MLRKDRLYEVRPINDLKDMLSQSVSLFGDYAAFRQKGLEGQISEITYKEFCADISAFGTALLDLGFGNKKIAVIGENRYEWCVTYLSVVNGVGTIVPLDRELPVDDLQYLLEQSEASAVIFSKKSLEQVDSVLGKLPLVKSWICMDKIEDERFLYYTVLLDNGR